MLENIASWIIHVISTLGYPGIVLTMGIESALIPLPSEIIMTFSGYLASIGQFNIWLVIIAGAVGNTAGSLVAYGLGYWGSERVVRRLVKKFGKYILFTEEELDKTEALMHKYKGAAVFIARFTPGVRTVISLPAGIAKVPLPRFIFLTFAGGFLWSGILAYFGFILGKNWSSLEVYFRKFEIGIGILIVGFLGFYIYSRLKGQNAKAK